MARKISSKVHVIFMVINFDHKNFDDEVACLF